MRRSAVVLLGPPGCGKTTVADQLGAMRGVRPVITGRLLREEAAADDPRGAAIRRHLERGDLVPTETVTNVIIRELSLVTDETLVFDGYPRNRDQLTYFLRTIEHLKFHLASVIVLELPVRVADDRLAGRHRADDSVLTVEERRETYEQETVPLIEELEERYPDHVHRVSAEPPVETVLRSVIEVLRQEDVAIGGENATAGKENRNG